MRRSVHLLDGPLPVLSQLILIVTAIIVPDTLRVNADDLRELRVGHGAVQNAQVADEDSLELRGVAVAIVRVARFADDVRIRVREVFDGGFGDALGRLQVVAGAGGRVGAAADDGPVGAEIRECRGVVKFDQST